MTIQNMTNVNMLIRKVYLLAGVIIAANMFIVNEVKASEENNEEINIEGQKFNKNFPFIRILSRYSNFIVSWENTIISIGTLFLSVANNYFKWWGYNAGQYGEFGCCGARSENFLNGIFQIDTNFNLGRGIFFFCSELFYERMEEESFFSFSDAPFLVFLYKWSLSVNLIVHIHKFIISISLDSIIWWGIGMFLEPKVKEGTELHNMSESKKNKKIITNNEKEEKKIKNLPAAAPAANN